MPSNIPTPPKFFDHPSRKPAKPAHTRPTSSFSFPNNLLNGSSTPISPDARTLLPSFTAHLNNQATTVNPPPWVGDEWSSTKPSQVGFHDLYDSTEDNFRPRSTSGDGTVDYGRHQVQLPKVALPSIWTLYDDLPKPAAPAVTPPTPITSSREGFLPPISALIRPVDTSDFKEGGQGFGSSEGEGRGKVEPKRPRTGNGLGRVSSGRVPPRKKTRVLVPAKPGVQHLRPSSKGSSVALAPYPQLKHSTTVNEGPRACQSPHDEGHNQIYHQDDWLAQQDLGLKGGVPYPARQVQQPTIEYKNTQHGQAFVSHNNQVVSTTSKQKQPTPSQWSQKSLNNQRHDASNNHSVTPAPTQSMKQSQRIVIDSSHSTGTAHSLQKSPKLTEPDSGKQYPQAQQTQPQQVDLLPQGTIVTRRDPIPNISVTNDQPTFHPHHQQQNENGRYRTKFIHSSHFNTKTKTVQEASIQPIASISSSASSSQQADQPLRHPPCPNLPASHLQRGPKPLGENLRYIKDGILQSPPIEAYLIFRLRKVF